MNETEKGNERTERIRELAEILRGSGGPADGKPARIVHNGVPMVVRRIVCCGSSAPYAFCDYEDGSVRNFRVNLGEMNDATMEVFRAVFGKRE